MRTKVTKGLQKVTKTSQHIFPGQPEASAKDGESDAVPAGRRARYSKSRI
jgi:hypothetical protein